jgi:guanine deaminase
MRIRTSFWGFDNDNPVLFENALIEFDKLGNLVNINETLAEPSAESSTYIDMDDFLCLPALCDAHSHFAQFDIRGLGDGELLDWLRDFVFPGEIEMEDYNKAYNRAYLYFKESKKFGTSRIASYSTSGEIATDAAFKAAEDLGVRAFIGNSMSDENFAEELCKSVSENIAISERICNKWHNSNGGKLKYIASPRFAGSCSMKLMRACADFAKANDLNIQTHLSENKAELDLIKSRFPEIDTYTEVYDNAGLLGDKTFLGHSVYLSDRELEIIKEKESIIVHCPSSNIFLRSGIMPTRKYLDLGMKVCAGNDIGGGVSLSMFNEAKSIIESSKIYKTICDQEKKELNSVEALKMIYKNECFLEGKSTIINHFATGKELDLIFIKKERINFKKNIENEQNIASALIYYMANNYVDAVKIGAGKIEEIEKK